MDKKIVRVPEISVGDTCGYSMIEYHMDFTEIVNKLLKSNNIDYKLFSMSYGRTDTTDDWRVLFKIEEGE
jgi:putative aminopeptidase FrvX